MKLPNWPSPVTGAPNALTIVPGKSVKLTQTLFGPALIEGWSPLAAMSPTFENDLPPSVEMATRMFPLVLTRYVIQRFPKRSQASCSSQQISPSGSAAVLPITRLDQVRPLLKETFVERPATTSASVDIVTTFDGFVGLTAIASSASFPGLTLVSKFGIGAAAVASAAIARAPANARTIVEKSRPRMLSPLS